MNQSTTMVVYDEVQLRFMRTLQIWIPVNLAVLAITAALSMFAICASPLSRSKRCNLYFLLGVPYIGLILQMSQWAANVWRVPEYHPEMAYFLESLYWFGRPMTILPVGAFAMRLCILYYGTVDFRTCSYRPPLLLRQSHYGPMWMICVMLILMIPFLVIFTPWCVLGGKDLLKLMDFIHVGLQSFFIFLIFVALILLKLQQPSFYRYNVTATMLQSMFGIAMTLGFGLMFDNIGWVLLGYKDMLGGALVVANYDLQAVLYFACWWFTFAAMQEKQYPSTIYSFDSTPGDILLARILGRNFQLPARETISDPISADNPGAESISEADPGAGGTKKVSIRKLLKIGSRDHIQVGETLPVGGSVAKMDESRLRENIDPGEAGSSAEKGGGIVPAIKKRGLNNKAPFVPLEGFVFSGLCIAKLWFSSGFVGN